jgi:hypothetical protein
LIAAEPVKIGSDSYGEVTLESLEVLGSIKLNGTTVSKRLLVTGHLIANSAHLHEIEAEGDVKLKDSNLEAQVCVSGSLQACGSEFCQPLIFTGQKALFSKCKLSGITVRRDAAFKAKQILELKDRTIVDGPVVFEGGNGEVLLYAGSKIHGSVTGGKVTYKN